MRTIAVLRTVTYNEHYIVRVDDDLDDDAIAELLDTEVFGLADPHTTATVQDDHEFGDASPGEIGRAEGDIIDLSTKP